MDVVFHPGRAGLDDDRASARAELDLASAMALSATLRRTAAQLTAQGRAGTLEHASVTRVLRALTVHAAQPQRDLWLPAADVPQWRQALEVTAADLWRELAAGTPTLWHSAAALEAAAVFAVDGARAVPARAYLWFRTLLQQLPAGV